jgi:hypothetical protein
MAQYGDNLSEVCAVVVPVSFLALFLLLYFTGYPFTSITPRLSFVIGFLPVYLLVPLFLLAWLLAKAKVVEYIKLPECGTRMFKIGATK